MNDLSFEYKDNNESDYGSGRLLFSRKVNMVMIF